MLDIKKIKISEYMEKLSSKDPIPGGGGSAAINMALAAALISMVCNLTIGKKKFIDVENQIIEIRDRALEKIKKFLDLSNEDAKVFLPLSRAYSIPSLTKEEKKLKNECIEPLLFNAAKVPFDIIKEGISMLDDLEFLVDNSSKLAISDIGVSCITINAALKAAILNIKINTKYMKNRSNAAKMNRLARIDIKMAAMRLDKIYKRVYKEL